MATLAPEITLVIKDRLAGDGSAWYSFEFTYELDAHILVQAGPDKDCQKWKSLGLGTHYTVRRETIGGTIIVTNQGIVDAWVDPYDFNLLIIMRVYPEQQETVIPVTYDAQSTNTALNRLAYQTQQLGDKVDFLYEVPGITSTLGTIEPPNERGRLVKINNDNGDNVYKGAGLYENSDGLRSEVDFRIDQDLRVDGNLQVDTNCNITGTFTGSTGLFNSLTISGSFTVDTITGCTTAIITNLNSTNITNSANITTDYLIVNVEFVNLGETILTDLSVDNLRVETIAPQTGGTLDIQCTMLSASLDITAVGSIHANADITTDANMLCQILDADFMRGPMCYIGDLLRVDGIFQFGGLQFKGDLLGANVNEVFYIAPRTDSTHDYMIKSTLLDIPGIRDVGADWIPKGVDTGDKLVNSDMYESTENVKVTTKNLELTQGFLQYGGVQLINGRRCRFDLTGASNGNVLTFSSVPVDDWLISAGSITNNVTAGTIPQCGTAGTWIDSSLREDRDFVYSDKPFRITAGNYLALDDGFVNIGQYSLQISVTGLPAIGQVFAIADVDTTTIGNTIIKLENIAQSGSGGGGVQNIDLNTMAMGDGAGGLINSGITQNNNDIIFSGRGLSWNGGLRFPDGMKILFNPSAAVIGKTLMFVGPPLGTDYTLELVAVQPTLSGHLPDPAPYNIGDIIEIVDNAGTNEWAVIPPVIPRPAAPQAGLVPQIGIDGTTVEWNPITSSGIGTGAIGDFAQYDSTNTVIGVEGVLPPKPDDTMDQYVLRTDSVGNVFWSPETPGVHNVTAYTLAMGDGSGGLSDSPVKVYGDKIQVDPLYTIEAEKAILQQLDLGTAGAGKIALYSTAPNDMSVAMQWRVDWMAVNSTLPLLVKKLADGSCALITESVAPPEPTIINPIENGTALWVGHSTPYETRYIKSNPLVKTYGRTIDGWTFNLLKINSLSSVLSSSNPALSVEPNLNIIQIDPNDNGVVFINYNANIDSITFTEPMHPGSNTTLYFLTDTDGLTVTFPSTWLWPDGNNTFISISGKMKAVLLYCSNRSGSILATFVRAGTAPPGGVILPIPPFTNMGTAVYISPFGHQVKSRTALTYEKTIQNWFFAALKVQSYKVKRTTITANAGVLNLNFDGNFNYFVYTHSADLTAITVSIDAEVARYPFVFNLRIYTGASSQRTLPLPGGCYSVEENLTIKEGHATLSGIWTGTKMMLNPIAAFDVTA